MSLDLYVISKEPVKHSGTGVFVRENGKTKELSQDECKTLFPDYNCKEQEYENNELWHGNITHNLGKMAEKVSIKIANGPEYSLYQLLWRPEETGLLGNNQELTFNYAEHIFRALEILKENPDYYKKYNPENGWGNYDVLVSFTTDFVNTIGHLPVVDNCNYTIEASR